MKAQIFCGPPRSGKSRKANEMLSMYEDNEQLYIDGYNIKTPMKALISLRRSVRPETKIVVVDTRDFQSFNFDCLYHIIDSGEIVSTRDRAPYLIKAQIEHLIFIVPNYMERINVSIDSFKKRFDIVEFTI